jgi:hypothetical protein
MKNGDANLPHSHMKVVVETKISTFLYRAISGWLLDGAMRAKEARISYEFIMSIRTHEP